MSQVMYHPDTKKPYLTSFHFPRYTSELRSFLKQRGYRNLKRLNLQQLRALYIKVNIEERCEPL